MSQAQSNIDFFMAKIEALERRVLTLEGRQSYSMLEIMRKPQGSWTDAEKRIVAAWQESWCSSSHNTRPVNE